MIARIEGGKACTTSLELLDRIGRAFGGRRAVEFEGVRTKAARRALAIPNNRATSPPTAEKILRLTLKIGSLQECRESFRRDNESWRYAEALGAQRLRQH